MVPQKGQFVKVYFRNGYVEEGFVQDWGEKIHLVSTDRSTSTVINNPDDIFLFKIFLDKSEDKQVVSDVSVDNDLEPKGYCKDQNLRALKLAELHKLSAKEERERVRRKLTEFKPTYGQQVEYDNYSILRDQSVFRNPSEED